MMKSILTTIAFLALAVSGLAQTRSVIVNTSGVVQSPTNFWSADVTNARSGLGLGTAATNPASAFQSASVNLSNLASSNGGILTNIQASNLVGFINITNIPTAVTLSNIDGILSLEKGGTAATNADNARQNLGASFIGNALFTATNESSARVFIGALSTNGDAINLTNFPAFLLRTNGSGASLTNIAASNISGTVGTASNVTGIVSIINGGSGATTAGGARTNLGGTTVGNAVFTATNAAAAADAIGLGATNQVGFDSVQANDFTVSDGGTISFEDTGSIEFGNAAGPTRTNLGLGWSALTNTSTAGFNTSLYGSGTNPVLYNTNGEVVSPTNFWQVAPITTTFIESQPTTNQTTNMPAGRNLHIHSIAPSTVGITNTIALPTTNSFNGDVALVVHQGPTSSVTAVRTAGASTNLITLNQFEEAVEFVYYNSVWQFNHNLSYIEPIFFSGTNATANAAASRTNLGATTVGNAVFTATNAAAAATAIGLGTTNLVQFAYVESPYFFVGDGTNGIDFETDAVAAITRTNLGIGSGATNTVSFGKIRVPTGELTIEDPVNDASIITFPTDTDPVVLGADYWDHAAVRTSLGLGSGITTNLVLKNGSNQDTYMNFSNGILIYGSTVAP
jgi:hypothetical protein